MNRERVDSDQLALRSDISESVPVIVTVYGREKKRTVAMRLRSGFEDTVGIRTGRRGTAPIGREFRSAGSIRLHPPLRS